MIGRRKKGREGSSDIRVDVGVVVQRLLSEVLRDFLAAEMVFKEGECAVISNVGGKCGVTGEGAF